MMTYEQALRNYHNVLDDIRNQPEGTTILSLIHISEPTRPY